MVGAVTPHRAQRPRSAVWLWRNLVGGSLGDSLHTEFTESNKWRHSQQLRAGTWLISGYFQGERAGKLSEADKEEKGIGRANDIKWQVITIATELSAAHKGCTTPLG